MLETYSTLYFLIRCAATNGARNSIVTALSVKARHDAVLTCKAPDDDRMNE